MDFSQIFGIVSMVLLNNLVESTSIYSSAHSFREDQFGPYFDAI
jgi:hypothetical protein